MKARELIAGASYRIINNECNHRFHTGSEVEFIKLHEDQPNRWAQCRDRQTGVCWYVNISTDIEPWEAIPTKPKSKIPICSNCASTSLDIFEDLQECKDCGTIYIENEDTIIPNGETQPYAHT